MYGVVKDAFTMIQYHDVTHIQNLMKLTIATTALNTAVTNFYA